MASRQPFAIDTMSFWEWVQWIMLPTFEQIIAQQGALPRNSQITPMVAEALQNSRVKSSKLIEFFQRLDQLLSDNP